MLLRVGVLSTKLKIEIKLFYKDIFITRWRKEANVVSWVVTPEIDFPTGKRTSTRSASLRPTCRRPRTPNRDKCCKNFFCHNFWWSPTYSILIFDLRHFDGQQIKEVGLRNRKKDRVKLLQNFNKKIRTWVPMCHSYLIVSLNSSRGKRLTKIVGPLSI